MSGDPQAVPAGTFTAPALLEWNHHVESVLRGLAHALNNRAAALSAVLELSREPVDDDPEATREILAGEMKRVSELVAVVRAMGAPRPETEALAPADLVKDLEGALSLHADLRDGSVRVSAESAPPVRVARWMLLRALISTAARARPTAGQRTVALQIVAQDDWMVARADGDRAAGGSLYAAELARAMGGEPLPDGSGFRIPTLELLRRRGER
jgi:hypothetical protein